MTQTMPPSQAISAALTTPGSGASPGAGDDEFAGTFRKQLDQASTRDTQRSSGNRGDSVDEGAASSSVAPETASPESAAGGRRADATRAGTVGAGFFAADAAPGAADALALPPALGDVDSSSIPGLNSDALIATLPAGEVGDGVNTMTLSASEALTTAIASPAELPPESAPGLPTERPGALGEASIQTPDVAQVALVNGAIEPSSAASAVAAQASPSTNRGARAQSAHPLGSDAMGQTHASPESGRSDVSQVALLKSQQATASAAKPDAEVFARTFSRAGDGASMPGTAVAAATPGVAPGVAAQTSATAPLMPPQLTAVQTPLGDPHWASAIGARLVISAAQNMHSASIAINPRDLGPINVNMTVRDDELSMSFVAQHAPVREAIEAALPRLREMFSGEGVNLGDVDVLAGHGRDDANAQADGNTDGTADGESRGTADGRAQVLLPETDVRLADGLIDTFA